MAPAPVALLLAVALRAAAAERRSGGAALLQASSRAAVSQGWAGLRASVAALAALDRGRHGGAAVGRPAAPGLAASAPGTEYAAFPTDDGEPILRRDDVVLRHLFVWNDEDLPSILRLPPEWSDSLSPSSVRRVSAGPSSEVFLASLRTDPSVEVAVKKMETNSPALQRELNVRRRLDVLHRSGFAPSAQVVPMLAFEVFDSASYFLMPACEITLKRLADSQRRKLPEEPGEPLLTPELALVVIVDVLRGLRNLEEAGILHNALHEGNIMVRETQAFIIDFSQACLALEDDSGRKRAEFLGGEERLSSRLSPYRTAPEVVGGVPTGHANSVWSAGLILARLALGYVPTMPEREWYAIDREEPGEWDPTEAERIRRRIAREFDIKRSPGFGAAPGYIQELLEGMLEKDEARRLTAEQALRIAEKAADDIGVIVPPELSLPQRLPEGSRQRPVSW